MNELYETNISDARWWAYDIPGNIGWITWFVCTGLCLRQGLNWYSVLMLIVAAVMLRGIIELISERIAKIDRILPRIRLLRGFGALTMGGILGVPVAVIGFVSGISVRMTLVMLFGAILCGIFAGLLFAGYKKR